MRGDLIFILQFDLGWSIILDMMKWSVICKNKSRELTMLWPGEYMAKYEPAREGRRGGGEEGMGTITYVDRIGECVDAS